MRLAIRLADEVTRLFLFAGQSNMIGSDAHVDRIDDYPNFRGAGEAQTDVLYSYILGNGDEASKGWVPLKPLQSFGPELTFARRVRQQTPFPIAIIKSAVGGTTVAFDWNPDAPDNGQKLYPRTLKLIRKSLDELDKRGVRYQLEAIMWHQGENDMLDRKLYKQYTDGLAKLIARFRAGLNAPELKWYIGEISEKGIWGMDHRENLGVLRQQQEQVLKADRRFKNGLPIAKSSRVRLFVLAGQRNMEGEDAFVSEIGQYPTFASLATDQNNVLFRYSLGGGMTSSVGWEPLGPGRPAAAELRVQPRRHLLAHERKRHLLRALCPEQREVDEAVNRPDTSGPQSA